MKNGRANPISVKKHFRGFVCVFLSVLLLFTIAVPVLTHAEDKKLQKDTSYQISVVYDNSESMYFYRKKQNSPIEENRKRWSYAKYALQVFSGMLSENSQLSIYPMNPMTVDGREYSYDNPYEPDSTQDFIGNIDTCYTSEFPNDTPIDAVEKAIAGFKESEKSSKDKKCLIILSDGGFTKTEGEIHKRLSVDEKDGIENILRNCDDNINVQFLYINPDPDEKHPEKKNYRPSEERINKDNVRVYDSDANTISDKLTEMCNSIYQRDELTDDNSGFNGHSFKTDLSIGNFLVFVENEDVTNNNVYIQNSKSGAKAEATKTMPIKISSEKAYQGKEKKLGDKLRGSIFKFEKSFKAGDYTIEGLSDIVGDNVHIYYEPEVKVNLKLLDKTGADVSDEKNGVPEGDYILEGTLVDVDNNEKNVTGSKLLRSDKYKQPYFSAEGLTFTGEQKNRAKVTLTAGKDFDVEVFGHYLGNTISSKDNKKLRFDFKVTKAIVFKWEEEPHRYAKIEKGSWEDTPLVAHITMDGKPLSAKQMEDVKANMEVAISSDKKEKDKEEESKIILKSSRFEYDFDNSLVKIYIGYPKKGQYKDIPDGDYDLVLRSRINDINASGVSEIKHFKVNLLTELIWTFINIFVVIFIIGLIIFIATRKVLPKNAYFCYRDSQGRNHNNYVTTKRGVPSDLTGTGDLNCRLYPVTIRLIRRSENAKIGIASISPRSNVKRFTIDGELFTKKRDKWYCNGEAVSLDKLKDREIILSDKSGISLKKKVTQSGEPKTVIINGTFYVNSYEEN